MAAVLSALPIMVQLRKGRFRRRLVNARKVIMVLLEQAALLVAVASTKAQLVMARKAQSVAIVILVIPLL
jgi:hypothetical protein